MHVFYLVIQIILFPNQITFRIPGMIAISEDFNVFNFTNP